MTAPLASLLFFAAWTLGLVVVGLAPYRVGSVLLGKARPNEFPATVPHGPDWYQRLMRAHANCVENLPVFASVVLAGHVMGVKEGLFATLAQVVAVARVGQSIAHISSGRNLVINVRFSFFVVQVCAVATMIGLLATR